MGNVTVTAFPMLAEYLNQHGRIGVLVSGGCDSEVLQRAAVDVLGSGNTTAFNAVTPFIANHYLELLRQTAVELDVRLVQVEVDLLSIDKIKQNSPERCYFCKKAICTRIREAAEHLNITTLADGTNLDDTTEHRPGVKAAEELQIEHPFLCAGMTKADVRVLGGLLGMQNPNRPSDSCLATRLQVNTPITRELLSLVGEIEQSVRAAVKGRLRARVSEKQIILEYEAVDNELIEACKQEFLEIADNRFYCLVFREML
jgi:uncharacterized protein